VMRGSSLWLPLQAVTTVIAPLPRRGEAQMAMVMASSGPLHAHVEGLFSRGRE
jgi:hypothetical protein